MNNILSYHFWMVFLSAIVINYVYMITYQKFSDNKIKCVSEQYLILIFTSFIITINNLYNPILPIRALASAAIYFIMYKTIFKESLKTTFCKTCLMTLVSFVLDPVLSITISFACENIQELNVNTIPKLLITCIFSYTYFKIFKSEKNRKRFNSLLELMETNKKILIYFTILVLVAHAYNVLLAYNYVDYKYYTALLILIIFISYFSYIFIHEIFDNISLTLKNKYLNDNLINYQKTADNYRTLKHNLKNDLFIIARSKDKEKAIRRTYEKYNQDEEWVNNIGSIPSGLQGIIFLKMEFAENNKVKFYMDNKIDFEKLDEGTPLYLDTCEVIAICLDNAIEASIDTEEKLICMGLYNDDDCYTINITNSFNNFVDIDKLGEKNYSTKNRNSGIGLNYIANLNKDIKIKRIISDTNFKTIITIKKVIN